jgi:DNA-binding response OmpR family regulator
LQEYFTQSGYQVDTVSNGDELHQYRQEHSEPNIILLDVMMPGEDGFALCQSIRKNSNVPIIMLTAVSNEMDQIVGLEIGADDYVAKPFNPRQLMARVKALLRRTQVEKTSEGSALPRTIRFGEWCLDTLSHRLSHQSESEPQVLSGNEFTLLMLFLTHPNQVLDRDTISQSLHGREALPFERGLDVQLSRLRQRLGKSEQHPQYIKTLRGNGYMLTTPVAVEF